MNNIAVLAIVLFVGSSWSYPAGDDHGLVLTSDGKPDKTEEKTTDVDIPLNLQSMEVFSNVTNRYGHTVISSRYANPSNKAKEATFTIILPGTAFITGFIMEIKGKQYKAYVEEKKKAKRIYDEAVASGIGAAHVAADARDSNRFTVSMNVEPQEKVIFNLTYEQLLVRKNGKYELAVNLHPGQLVKHLDINVYINETRRLKDLATPAMRTGNEIVEDIKQNEFANIKIVNEAYSEAYIHFAPSIEQQKEMAKQLKKDAKEKDGLAGQFIVEYDVERDPSGGEVLVTEDGYFVHFFAPSKLTPIPKHVVFVLDVSGSMSGRKIEQVREAMQIILGQLTPQDYFNLVEFSFSAKVWDLDHPERSPVFDTGNRNRGWFIPEESQKTENQKLPPAYPANQENIAKAKEIISKMEANGGTNIYDALSTAVNTTKEGVKAKTLPKPIIIFLTDGDATDGETNTDVIIKMVNDGNKGANKAALFTLAFGSYANKDFLKKVSLKNSGFMRSIYESADASLQLQDFYKTISSPLLSNIEFKYPETEDGSLTKHKFDILFDGGELIVSGKIKDEKCELDEFNVNAMTIGGLIDFPCTVIKIRPRPTVIGKLERLWAYMTIKELLDKSTANDEKEDGPNKKRALETALKYSFVTPVTSLVVVKPNETKSVDAEEALPSFPETVHDRIIGGYGGGGEIFAAPAAALAPQFSLLDIRGATDVDADAIPYITTTIRAYQPTTYRTKIYRTTVTPTTTIKTELQEVNDLIMQLPWMRPLISEEDLLTLGDKSYHIGRNQTVVEEKSCNVTNSVKSGKCTLIFNCSEVHSKLTDVGAYKNYFCSLESGKYAGVCCVYEETEDNHKIHFLH